MTWTAIKRIDDQDQNVAKFVFSNDTAVSEAVLYKYPTYRERTVICISTQSGCPVGCRFCGAGDYFVRNLTEDEIVAQAEHALLEAKAEEGVEPHEMKRLQIMFMSMGEPLLNLNALAPAIRRLYAAYPTAALLISTSAPKVFYGAVNELSVEVPTVGLQFSVHESTDAARDELVPFKKKLTLAQIAQKGEEWFAATGRKPFFNYCAHDGNSSAADADRITALYDPRIWNATVSVVCERNEGLPATNDHQRSLAVDFAALLVERGHDVRVFDPAGQDTIGGGCGQLWFVQNWMEEHPELAKPSVGAGLPERHAPTLENLCLEVPLPENDWPLVPRKLHWTPDLASLAADQAEYEAMTPEQRAAFDRFVFFPAPTGKAAKRLDEMKVAQEAFDAAEKSHREFYETGCLEIDLTPAERWGELNERDAYTTPVHIHASELRPQGEPISKAPGDAFIIDEAHLPDNPDEVARLRELSRQWFTTVLPKVTESVIPDNTRGRFPPIRIDMEAARKAQAEILAMMPEGEKA